MERIGVEPENVAQQESEIAREETRVVRRRPAGWALGLPFLALLVVVAAMRVGPAIEINIRREATTFARGAPDSALVKAGTRIVVAGRDVRIVSDDDLPAEVRDETSRRAASVPAVRSVTSETTGYVTLSPYAFRVKRSEAGIELSGGVPDAALRERLVAEASRFVPPEQVEDRLRLAAGAPDGFAAAASHLVATLGSIESAEGVLSGRRLTAVAAPRDTAAYNRVLAALRSPPHGYRASELDILPPRIAPFVWTARRDAGGLALGGAVPSEEKRGELLKLAEELLPDMPVRDAMQTARGLDRSIDFLATARSTLDILGRLTAGEAQIADRRFTLTGETMVRGGRTAIAARLKDTLPHALGAPLVELSLVPASPFLFSVRRHGGRVELSGYISDEKDRAAALTLAAARFPGERATERLVVVEGAPEGFPVVMRTMLETLSDFAEGEAALRDRSLLYTGRVLYGQLAARIRRTVPTQVPDGWQAKVELEPVRPPGALDAYLCGDLLGDAARRNPVRFEPGQAVPAANAGPALDVAGAIARRCGRVGIRIVHHLGGADPEAGKDLAADRARALATALAERGATARFTVEGTAAPDKTSERNEFRVAPL